MKVNTNKNTTEALANIVAQGFEIVAKAQEEIKNTINEQETKIKQITKANYNAHTKMGKSRFVKTLNDEGMSISEIADTLNLKKGTVAQRIRDAKRNGK